MDVRKQQIYRKWSMMTGAITLISLLEIGYTPEIHRIKLIEPIVIIKEHRVGELL